MENNPLRDYVFGKEVRDFWYHFIDDFKKELYPTFAEHSIPLSTAMLLYWSARQVHHTNELIETVEHHFYGPPEEGKE